MKTVPAATRPTKATPATPPDAPKPQFAVKSYGLSDCGQVRTSNEDCFLIAELARAIQVHQTNTHLPPKATFGSHRAHVFVIADGVGGNHAGEVASELTVRTIEDYALNTLKRFTNLQAGEEQAALRDLQNALNEADDLLFAEAEKHAEWRGMATTTTMALAVNWRLFVAHAGDSRCYLHSGGRLQQLTQDHTLTAELVRRGIITPEAQATHQWRHVVTNVLGGTDRGVQVEVHSLDLHPGDAVLLCSDGLSDMVSEERIAEILREETDPRSACEHLVNDANQNGGKDNVTVVVARF